jgi:Xaa-Pro dipeptidase
MPAEAPSIRDPSAHYASHHAALQARYEGLLDDLPWDSVVIWSGSPRLVFRDDRHYPFRAGPFYQQWVPARDHAESALLLRPGRRPLLALNLPEDYWHSVPEPPRAAWVDSFELERAADLESLRALLPDDLSGTALIGDALGAPTAWGFGAINPAELVTPLEFARLYKTPYEVACIAAANQRGARGHLAAREAFEAGESELGINLAYLAATRLTEAELPYDNIVALNDHVNARPK